MKDDTQKLLDKASRAIRASEMLLTEGDADFAASRAYYAMFYIAEALLNEKELHYRKHGGVHAGFGEQYAKTGLLDSKFHRWLLDAFDRRIQSDYGIDALLANDDVVRMIEQAREFLQQACLHLSAP